MQKFALLFVFIFGLALKVSVVAGAENPKPELKTEKAEAVAAEPKLEPKAEKATVEKAAPVLAKEDSDDEDTLSGDGADDSDQEQVRPQERTQHSNHHNTKIENNIRINGERISYGRRNNSLVATGGNSQAAAAAEVLGTRASVSAPSKSSAAITPMVGYTAYSGDWMGHVTNFGTFGLAIDLPVSEALSLELSGTYGKFTVTSYSISHDFNQYSGGGIAKVYLSRGQFQPYLGAGMQAVYYQGMYTMNMDPYNNSQSNQVIGAGQAVVGGDIALGDKISVGARGSYLVPLVNRPNVMTNGPYAAPGFEDASLMDSAYYQVMATLKVSF